MLEVITGFILFYFIFLGGWKKAYELCKNGKQTSVLMEKVLEQNEPVMVSWVDPSTAFKGFIGNKQAISQIKRLIKYSQANNEMKIPSIGLFGPRSVGKTEIARRIGKAMNLPMLTFSKSTLTNEDTFFKQVSKEIKEFSGGTLEAPPMIIFLDEAHVLPRRIQDSLLTALEKDDRCFRSKAGDINTKNITFIIATTDPGKLTPALISRLTVFNLRAYDTEEIVQILKNRIQSDDSLDKSLLNIPEEVFRFVAIVSRGVPRKAIEILQQTGMALALDEIQKDPESIKKDLKTILDCDDAGYTFLDKQYIRLLYQNKNMGVNFMSNALGTDKENITNFIEPWLIQNELIEVSRNGRKLTDKGEQLAVHIV